MQYRKDKNGNELSILGYGCMRFSSKNGKPDLEKTEKEVMEGISRGINYYDTAYVYPGSEDTLGRILERNKARDKVNIATKLPHYLIKNIDAAEKYFEEELRRLRTDHIDYYLMHMLTDLPTWNRLQSIGIEDWIADKKRSGVIRNAGFSYHGNADMFCKLVDAYDWDFCQIQYNYYDETSQAGKDGLAHAHAKGLPVVIMEPLRGGRLVNALPQSARNIFAEYPMKKSPSEWAFDWLWNQPPVTVVLSGMNSLEMVRENTDAADKAHAGMLAEEDLNMFRQVVDEIRSHLAVGCTGCRYCMPCPQNVDIPGTFFAYNLLKNEGYASAIKSFFMTTALRHDPTFPSNCIGCGRCEKHCPQHIEIRQKLKEAEKALEGPIIRFAAKVTRTVMRY